LHAASRQHATEWGLSAQGHACLSALLGRSLFGNVCWLPSRPVCVASCAAHRGRMLGATRAHQQQDITRIGASWQGQEEQSLRCTNLCPDKPRREKPIRCMAPVASPILIFMVLILKAAAAVASISSSSAAAAAGAAVVAPLQMGSWVSVAFPAFAAHSTATVHTLCSQSPTVQGAQSQRPHPPAGTG